jgi:GNAT superfamily N-acetyltransferase
MPEIRDAVPDDISELCDVFRRSSLSNVGDRPALLAHPDVLEFDSVCVHENRTRVAVEAGRVVGFASTTLAADFIELDDLFVDPDWMRRGIALALIRDAEAIARSRGVSRIEATGNHHARAFYAHAGFVEMGPAQTRFGPAIRMRLGVS